MRFASCRRRQTRETGFLRNVRDTKSRRLSQGDVSTHKSAVQLIGHYGQSEMTSELLNSNVVPRMKKLIIDAIDDGERINTGV